MKQVTYPYEILIRLNRSGIVGAQYQTITDIIDDDDVTVLASKEGSVAPLSLAGQTGVSLETVMGQAAATALLENEQLKGVNAQLALLTQSLQQRLDEANAKLAAQSGNNVIASDQAPLEV